MLTSSLSATSISRSNPHFRPLSFKSRHLPLIPGSDPGSPIHGRSGVRFGGVLHTGRSVLGSGVRLGPFSHTGRTVPTSKIRSSLLIPGSDPGSPCHDRLGAGT